MSDPDDDDLHGRQLVLLLVFFGAACGGLYFLGPSFLSGNLLACAAIAGFACHPARWPVEQFAWWNRLEQPSRRTRERRERALERQLAEAGARKEAEAGETAEHVGDGHVGDGPKHRRAGKGRIWSTGGLFRR